MPAWTALRFHSAGVIGLAASARPACGVAAGVAAAAAAVFGAFAYLSYHATYRSSRSRM